MAASVIFACLLSGTCHALSFWRKRAAEQAEAYDIEPCGAKLVRGTPVGPAKSAENEFIDK
eukprot:5289745-Amphidinium_carterae.1